MESTEVKQVKSLKEELKRQKQIEAARAYRLKHKDDEAYIQRERERVRKIYANNPEYRAKQIERAKARQQQYYANYTGKGGTLLAVI